MEQNLSERERKIRLGIGLIFLSGAIGSYLFYDSIYLTAGLLIAAIGFILNYFTCFCGTKKILNSLKSKIPR